MRLESKTLTELVAGQPGEKFAWLQRLWLAALFTGGIILWGRFLNWGSGPLNFADWAVIYGPRLAFLRSAILRWELPLHLSAPAVEDGTTLRFFASPDQILSPQVFLLPWLDAGRFVLLQFILMFALGFWALLLLRRRFQLSLLAFTILFALFSFNGHILAHASIGHASWAGYFLYAAFAVLVFDLLEGQAGWRWVAKTAFLASFMLLQGAYHPFIYLLFFLGLLALSTPRRFGWILAAGSFAVLISTWRLLPAALMLGKADNDFISGYPHVEAIWQYLTRLQTPNDITLGGGLIKPTGTWELSLFVGLIGAVFILYFGVVRALSDREAAYPFQALLVPCLGMALLSLDRVYGALRGILPFPPLTGERVAARFLGLAFVFLLIIACAMFQRWLDKNRPNWVRLIAMLLLFALGATSF